MNESTTVQHGTSPKWIDYQGYSEYGDSNYKHIGNFVEEFIESRVPKDINQATDYYLLICTNKHHNTQIARVIVEIFIKCIRNLPFDQTDYAWRDNLHNYLKFSSKIINNQNRERVTFHILFSESSALDIIGGMGEEFDIFDIFISLSPLWLSKNGNETKKDANNYISMGGSSKNQSFYKIKTQLDEGHLIKCRNALFFNYKQ